VDIEDNRDQPEEDQFKILIDPLSGGDLQKLSFLSSKARRDEEGQLVLKETMTKRIKEVQNYGVEYAKDDVRTASNGKELFALLQDADGTEAEKVIKDIVWALRDHSKLREGIPLSLGSQSDA